VARYGSCTIGAVEPPQLFAIATTSLPDATPGSPYGPVTLQVANVGTSTSPYVTTLKWRKVTLPRGLKLSSAAVLSGRRTSTL
jgi:hypothetical protein